MMRQPPTPCYKPLEITLMIRTKRMRGRRTNPVKPIETMLLVTLKSLSECYLQCYCVCDSKPNLLCSRSDLLSYWRKYDSRSSDWSIRLSFIWPRLLGFSNSLAVEFEELAVWHNGCTIVYMQIRVYFMLSVTMFMTCFLCLFYFCRMSLNTVINNIKYVCWLLLVCKLINWEIEVFTRKFSP